MVKHLRLKRSKNILHSLTEWKLKRVFAKSRPFIFRIDTTPLCNLKCISCTTKDRVLKPNEVRMMSLPNFEKIYSSIRKYAYRMTFYMEGEPMINPKLFEMIKIAGEDKVFTSFDTNFTLMKKELLKPLFDSKLDLISICLDGFTQEAYEQYRVNGDVESIKDGIKMVMEYKREHKVKHPFVRVYTILFNHVLPEVDLIKAFCKEHKVDQIIFRPDHSNLVPGTYTFKARKQSKEKCFWPWISMCIDAGGLVYPCAIEYEKVDRSPYGSLLENSLDEIWNNELYTETRKYLTGQSCNSDFKLPCYNCRWYKA